MRNSAAPACESDAMPHWSTLIRDIRDITPLLADADGFAACIDALTEPWRGVALDAVLGIESRGFILGAALARVLGTGFVPLRKPGKLPGPTVSQAYALEYGEDRLEMHVDAVAHGARAVSYTHLEPTRP